MLGILTLLLLAAAEVAPPEPPAAPFFAGNEELRGYILEALGNNPQIQARHAEWLAALQRVPQVTLDDPMFSLTSFLQSDQKRFGIAIEQMFPWFGTLEARRGEAAAEARAALARAQVARNAVVAGVKTAYFDLALLSRQSELVQSQAQIYDYIESTTLSRYGVGLARQEDVYRVQVAKAQLEDQYADLMQMRPAVEARLLEAIGRPPANGEISSPQPAELPPPPPPAPIVIAQVTAANPDLAAATEAINAREFGVALAQKTGYPNFTVGLGYDRMKDPPGEDFGRMAKIESAFMLAREAPMRGVAPVLSDLGANLAKERLIMKDMDMDDDVMLMFRVNVPIWRGRVRAAREEAALMRRAAEQEKQQTGLSLATAARMALYNYQAAQRQYDLYDNVLLPQAELIYENLQTGYGLGEIADFVDLIESVNTTLEFQLEQARATRNLQAAAAELERLMGGPWTTEEQ